MSRVEERALEKILGPSFGLERGAPLPLGATRRPGGINFSVVSTAATSVSLLLYAPGDPHPALEIPLDPRINRTGDVWHVLVGDVHPSVEYAYRMDRAANSQPEVHRFDRSAILLDPYARAICGGAAWGDAPHTSQRRCLLVDNGFDWGDDQPLNIPLSDSVIYELHVRGFTRDASSCAVRPGTFSGLVEKIPYLKDLGVSAVELMPIWEFEEADTNRVNPLTGERLLNYWGYQPIAFFAPNAAYAADPANGGAVHEFKQMVRAFHGAGIEVILDVVYNHTAEGDERGPTHSFRGIDNAVYYIVDRATGEYRNYSGCGNTLNCNHPIVRTLIVDSLHYWVTEMHVDGFRFDLASILGRGTDGAVLANPPLLESLAHDPVLAHTKLIAEAWDAAGLYQVGTFPAWGRWAEWNGRFRDDVRRFVRGEPGRTYSLATRLLGSPDLYQTSNREPYHSINFVTCHDGFTLEDLVSYDRKVNVANGEANADGLNDNLSWNCGAEGPTGNPAVLKLRRQQVRNVMTLLLLSQGVPMLLAGDEMGRTQGGNNNAYCHDNLTSWIDWTLLEKHSGLHRFVRGLIHFRRELPLLRRRRFASDRRGGGLSVDWHGTSLGHPDWSPEARRLAMHIFGPVGLTDAHLYVMANAHWDSATFELPVMEDLPWRRIVDTSLESPEDFCEPDSAPVLSYQRSYFVRARSTVVLLAAPAVVR